MTVELGDGRTLKGFARGRPNFDLQLQDLNGRFYFLQADEITTVQKQPTIMKPVQASPQELRDLVAYLSRVDEAGTGTPVEPKSDAGNIGFSRIQHPNPGDWLTYN